MMKAADQTSLPSGRSILDWRVCRKFAIYIHQSSQVFGNTQRLDLIALTNDSTLQCYELATAALDHKQKEKEVDSTLIILYG